MTNIKLEKGACLYSWQKEKNIHNNRILFCMEPENKIGWSGKYLITLKTKKSLKLFKNYHKEEWQTNWVTELIPLELKQGHKPERDDLVKQLKEQGYDGWYGTLHGNLTDMEYCIFDPLDNLEVTDIVILKPKPPCKSFQKLFDELDMSITRFTTHAFYADLEFKNKFDKIIKLELIIWPYGGTFMGIQLRNMNDLESVELFNRIFRVTNGQKMIKERNFKIPSNGLPYSETSFELTGLEIPSDFDFVKGKVYETDEDSNTKNFNKSWNRICKKIDKGITELTKAIKKTYELRKQEQQVAQLY